MIACEGNRVVIIEDITDPDGRMYRMEYQSRPDGRGAVAICRFNPWGVNSDGGGHLSGGVICMGPEHYNSDPYASSIDLKTAIQRARYWCTAFSVYKESGEFPQPGG